MGVSIAGQAAALASALLLGAGVGLLYDVFRVLRCRIRLKPLGGILDGLFWLAVTLSLFLHALKTGSGVLRFYMVAAVLGGAVVYFLLLSPLALKLGYFLADLAGLLLRLALLPVTAALALAKKIEKQAKKNFHYRRKWYRIRSITGTMDDTASARAAGSRGDGTDEREKCEN